MCTSTNPGIAVWWGAAISCAPGGRLMPSRGPIDSITPSRIRIPASGISVVGVSARAVCNRIVSIGGQHRSGMRRKRKREGSLEPSLGVPPQALQQEVYWPDVEVLAEAVPAAFG